MTGKDSRFSLRGQSHFRILLPPVLIVFVLGSALQFLDQSTEQTIPRDADLCPIDPERITGSAVFLFDFTKPLDATQTTLPGDLLRDVTERIERDTTLRVFSLTGSATAPRTLLQRLCKPFDSTDLKQVGEDQGKPRLECGGSAALSDPESDSVANRFCAERNALQGELNTLAGGAWHEEERVANAHLIEAFEDTRLDFAQQPKPHHLHVFSDLMQHSAWYSHLELDWQDWDFDEFAEVLETRSWLPKNRSDWGDLRVELFYVPRIGTTDRVSAKQFHQEFWKAYFAGAPVVMRDQLPMLDYTSAPLMNVPSAAEVAARERAAVEQRILETQRNWEALELEQRELEANWQRKEEAHRQQLAEMEKALERQRLAEAQRQASERSAEEHPQREPHRDRQPREVSLTPLQAEAPPLNMSDASLPPCRLEVPSNIESMKPEYPRRGNIDLGSARVTVRYLVDEQGQTVNDQVSLDPERSTADHDRYFQLFAQAALDEVRSWSFSFVDQNSESCIRRQMRSTSFDFRLL